MGIIMQNGKQFFPVPEPTPRLLFTSAVNRAGTDSQNTITYNVLRSGKQQLYIFVSDNGPITSITDALVINKNDISIENSFRLVCNDAAFIIGELDVEKNDVITIRTRSAQSNRGIILFVFEDANINNFYKIGLVGNINTSFYIDDETHVLECYKFGFYQGRTNYSYVLDPDAGDSVPTPNETSYYYGGTWAIRI